MRKQIIAALFAGTLLSPALVAADHDDWDDWYDGEVRIDLRVAGGPGAVVHRGDLANISFRTTADAYVAVYAIDARGFVRLLFPRYWDDDGWVESGRKVRLGSGNVAYALASFDPGIVYVQAIASPVPFDWRASGLAMRTGGCEWSRAGVTFRIQGDPYDGFNEVNRCLFPLWDEAVFVAADSYFYVGRVYDHPTYLCGVCRGQHRGYHDPWFRVRVDVSWDLERGRRYCRPVYRPVYVFHEGRRQLRHGDHDGSHRPHANRGVERRDDRRDRERRWVREERDRDRRIETRRERLVDVVRERGQVNRRSQERVGAPDAGDRSPAPAPAPPTVRRREASADREPVSKRVGAARRGATPPVLDSSPGDDGPTSRGAGSVASRGVRREKEGGKSRSVETQSPSGARGVAEAAKRARQRPHD